MDSAPDTFSDIFLGRQPLIDRHQAVIAYELLFRNTAENFSTISSGREATADVVCKAFAELGLATALGKQKAFINVDEDFVCDDAVEFLPKQTVLLEVDASQEMTPRLLDRCQQLKQIGYEFSISGITDYSEPLSQMLHLASYSKVDVNAVLPNGNMSSLLSKLRASHTKLIANRVESIEEKQRCTDLGFDIFQGYYFAHPVIVEGRRLDASQQGLIRLINLTNDNADLAKIESAFKSEPGLAINLLRLTNSAGAGLSVRISSIRHAVTVVGLRQIQRWLTLLMFSHAGGSSNLTNNPLLQLAALRGCFMELLAYRCF
ncbi:MAG: HDOD domain-containing protein, partial [Proteobacteria bacterium]|nr:HDOD domain-containing protein [Pseudomonadota bacterium]